MKILRNKFKKGATSFYIVAFSTLILLIVATSFAAIIISEIERTGNDDLSQSAYDSALAGVEDAKLAFYNYQNCKAQKTPDSNCQNTISMMENSDCYTVGRILGRIRETDQTEVAVNESVENNMQQAYTCVKVKTVLPDYRSTLSSAVQYKVVKVKFDNIEAKEIKTMKISWYTNGDAATYRFNNVISNKVMFPKNSILSGKQYAIPPTISLAMVQTATTFSFDQFTQTRESARESATNRGMIYLVPTNNATVASSGAENNSKGAWNGSNNVIGASAFVKSNNKNATNYPYAVYCNPSATTDFLCSAEIALPGPIEGTRNNDTFMFVVALPYGKPTTDFAMEFYCDASKTCSTQTKTDASGASTTASSNRASLSGVQVGVDSTGRANDLYRRVEVRLESAANDANLSVMGPLELTGGSDKLSGSVNNDSVLDKTLVVKSEHSNL